MLGGAEEGGVVHDFAAHRSLVNLCKNFSFCFERTVQRHRRVQGNDLI